MSTITRVSDSATTDPLLVLGYEATREGGNTITKLIGGGIAVTLDPAIPRKGELELLYVAEADAVDALELHSTADEYTLVDVDRTSVNMTYVVDGQVGIALDPETRDQWVVTVGFQEIIP